MTMAASTIALPKVWSATCPIFAINRHSPELRNGAWDSSFENANVRHLCLESRIIGSLELLSHPALCTAVPASILNC